MADQLSPKCEKAVKDGVVNGKVWVTLPEGVVENTLAAIGVIKPQAHGLNQVLEPGLCANLKEAEQLAIKTVREQLRLAKVMGGEPMPLYSEYASGVSKLRAEKIDRSAGL
jgi:hypothetical protein